DPLQRLHQRGLRRTIGQRTMARASAGSVGGPLRQAAERRGGGRDHGFNDVLSAMGARLAFRRSLTLASTAASDRQHQEQTRSDRGSGLAELAAATTAGGGGARITSGDATIDDCAAGLALRRIGRRSGAGITALVAIDDAIAAARVLAVAAARVGLGI